MDNQYVIHDAEKEKPEIEEFESRPGFSTARKYVLGLVDGKWEKVWYGTLGKYWHLSGERGKYVTVTHWTSLPPDPPKPRRWVKKEIEPNVVQVKQVGPVNFDVFAEAYGLPKVRNVMLTYEIEEDQP